MTRDEVLTLLDRRRDAVERRDERALAALYGETARLESPIAGVAVGRDAAVKATWAFFEGFSDATVVEDLFAIDDDRVALVAHLAGTHTGEIMGLPPSGRRFRCRAAFLLRVAEGVIVEEQRIYDFTGLLVQIGALKAKPA
jgi:predicted ester cyclase